MKCTTSCILAGAFIFASMFVSYRVNKQTLSSPLFQLLSNENKTRYIKIANERKNIYFKGFGLGLILSLIVLYGLNNKKNKLTKLTNICFVLATSFTVNYFFYILHPKSDYMVKHLNSQDEKNAWLKIYKTMQFNYHLGFVLGLIGMIFVGNSFC
tara:strand:+ start:2328 stop:2792 length:465 start_codon:yes stop_codon:yes gene_type:complete